MSEELDRFCDPTIINAEKLAYDLSNCAYIEGHLIDENQQHPRHMLMDICDKGNIDRVGDVIGLAQDEIRGLKREEPFDEGMLSLAHEYVLSRVLSDWLSIVYPAAEERWSKKAAAAFSALSIRIQCIAFSPAFTRRVPPF